MATVSTPSSRNHVAKLTELDVVENDCLVTSTDWFRMDDLATGHHGVAVHVQARDPTAYSSHCATSSR